MEREEGKIVVRTSHHWPHRSVETETSKLGKGEREGMETQDMGGGGQATRCTEGSQHSLRRYGML